MRNPFLFLLLYIGIGAFAQKLPNKQEASVWVPSTVRIDGKATEWGNIYKAFNHATDLYYTVANNERNLYFIFHADDQAVIFNKIMTGGITLVLKSNDHTQAITYPFFAKKNLSAFKKNPPNESYPSGITAEKYKDSISRLNNITLSAEAKEIVVTGFKNIDTLISVYNEYGLKASGRFDDKMGYTYEISIPITLLQSSLNKFNYQVIVNGGANKYIPEKAILTGGNKADGTPIPRETLDKAENAMNVARMARYATTDFSGEYTLAKAP